MALENAGGGKKEKQRARREVLTDKSEIAPTRKTGQRCGERNITGRT